MFGIVLHTYNSVSVLHMSHNQLLYYLAETNGHLSKTKTTWFNKHGVIRTPKLQELPNRSMPKHM